MNERVKKLLPYAGALGLGLLLVLEAQRGGTMSAGSEAPPFTLVTDDGSTFDLSAHRGEVVVVNFWATWCPPCRAEAPALARVHQGLQNGVMIGVAVDSGALDDATRAARRLGWEYPIAVGSRDVMAQYRVESLPTTYVIDAEGKIAWSVVGAVDRETLEEAIAGAR